MTKQHLFSLEQQQQLLQMLQLENNFIQQMAHQQQVLCLLWMIMLLIKVLLAYELIEFETAALLNVEAKLQLSLLVHDLVEGKYIMQDHQVMRVILPIFLLPLHLMLQQNGYLLEVTLGQDKFVRQVLQQLLQQYMHIVPLLRQIIQDMFVIMPLVK